jgi:hypothetical protein
MRLLLAILATGCAASSSGSLSSPQAVAELDFEALAFPVLSQECSSCHASHFVPFLAGGNQPGEAWDPLIDPASHEIRLTLVHFEPQVVALDAPAMSHLLTKGLHDGPALDAHDAEQILTWIQAEAAAAVDQ